jgi:hypothetical protein
MIDIGFVVVALDWNLQSCETIRQSEAVLGNVFESTYRNEFLDIFQLGKFVLATFLSESYT